MRRWLVLLIFLSLCLVTANGCRSRRAPQPQAAPPVSTSPDGAVSVPPPGRDFARAQPDARDVLSEDIVAANRLARERGLLRDAFFAFDASTLDHAAQEALRHSATWLRQNPEFRIRIEGHCDERGTEQYNLALGDRRAATAASYLTALGIDRSRISTVSYGEERPFEDGSNESAWAQNRRAHLVLADRR